MRYGLIILYALAVWLNFGSTPSYAADVTKYFTVVGTLPGEKEPSYKGKVVVKLRGQRLDVTWTLNDGSVSKGTGIAYTIDKNTILAISFGAGNKPGISVFELKDDGSAVGAWATGDDTRVGYEAWTPAK